MDSQDRGFSQFLHTAASYFPDSSAPATATASATATATATSSQGHGKKPPSAGEALSSAKVILDAAVSKLHKAESESAGDHKVDNAKVAAAAADVLAAAKHYGKMDENKHGKYVQKAEDYLHKYGQEHKTSAGNSTGHSSTPPPASQSASEHEENNYSKYFKQAEGFLGKF